MNDTHTSWREQLDRCSRYGSFSANRFLSLTALASDEEFQEAMEILAEKEILLDVSDLRSFEGSGKTAARLNLERKLSNQKIQIRDLDLHDPLRLFLEEIRAMPGKPDFSWAEAQCSLGDAQREKIAEGCLPRIASFAMELAGKGVLVMDLVQEGSLGLWQGLTAYAGQPLEKYLDRCIRMAMHAAITAQARADGIGTHLRNQMQQFRKTDSSLLGEMGRNPTLEEIASEMKIDLDTAETIQKMLQDASDNKKEDETEEIEIERDSEVDGTAYYQTRQRVNDLMGSLSQQERRLLNLRFGLETGKPMSPEQTAEILGISRENVLSMEEQALRKMRNTEETP